MRPAVMILVAALAGAAGVPDPHPAQGLADLFLDYVEVRYPQVDRQGDVLYVSIHRQRLLLIRGGRVVRSMPVSTAWRGPDCEADSHGTPLGLHRVARKIGEDVPEGGILRGRRFTGRIASPGTTVKEDLVTTRILWLEGAEPGLNRGPGVDSFSRAIYIHGTPQRARIGTPASEGCIRLSDQDVICLFADVAEGTPVIILDN